LLNKTFALLLSLQKALAFRLLCVSKHFCNRGIFSQQSAPVVAGMEPAFALHTGVWFCGIRHHQKNGGKFVRVSIFMANFFSNYLYTGENWCQKAFMIPVKL
jgi:hypothetical protein